MDPLTATTLTGTLTALLGSTAGEAGKSAWNALSTVTRQLLGRRAPASVALEAAAEGPVEARAQALEVASAAILVAAAENPEFSKALVRWHEQNAGTVQITGSSGVSNSVSGHAQVDRLIQAHTIGDVSFS